MRFTTAFIFTGLLLIDEAAAYAKGKGKGKGHADKGGPVVSTSVAINFGPSDVQVIRQYYTAHPVNLPPGLQKKLAKGKPLPPGWQKKLQPFPQDVYVRLGPPCDYCIYGVYDGYGVIYDKRTAIIMDVVQLVGDILR
jgi:hypothetical protein